MQYGPCRARGTTLYTDPCSLLQYVEFVDLEEGSPVAVVLHDELKVTGSDQKCNVFLGHVNVAPLTSWEDMDGKVLAIFKVRRGNGYRRGRSESEEREERGRGMCCSRGRMYEEGWNWVHKTGPQGKEVK